MHIGLVGLGKMGGNMVHRIHRDSDHQVVAFDTSEEAVQEAVGHGASGAATLFTIYQGTDKLNTLLTTSPEADLVDAARQEAAG